MCAWSPPRVHVPTLKRNSASDSYLLYNGTSVLNKHGNRDQKGKEKNKRLFVSRAQSFVFSRLPGYREWSDRTNIPRTICQVATGPQIPVQLQPVN